MTANRPLAPPSEGAERGPSYVEANPESPVAICTLSSHELLDDLARSALVDRVAIIGPLETENIGIERMISTVLARPRIRWLICCGEEARGRYQGHALRALFTRGVDAEGAVVTARSRRARLRMLGPEHVDAVRRQLRFRDLIGVHDVGTIARAVDECLCDDPGRFEEHVSLPDPEPIEVPTRPFRLREEDPNGFFVIQVDRGRAQLLIEHYSVDRALMHRIVGSDAESLCTALVEWGLVSRLEHAAYLGRELVKAELALRQGIRYRQDEPFS
ncbi:MAG: DUF4346 domain-containing protein [Chloroflexi bacterium]|nr:DUF4346 domain-containing protein [Chloroflexota bacterium]